MQFCMFAHSSMKRTSQGMGDFRAFFLVFASDYLFRCGGFFPQTYTARKLWQAQSRPQMCAYEACFALVVVKGKEKQRKQN